MSAKAYVCSAPSYESLVERNVPIVLRDGVPLATDIYFPALNGQPIQGKFPVILERTPYDKSAAGNVNNGSYFARRGYICAIQDVRGRYKSEGEWYPFAKEAPDGYDAVEWLAAQSGAMGRSGQWVDRIVAVINPLWRHSIRRT